jgi:hypothetical protein
MRTIQYTLLAWAFVVFLGACSEKKQENTQKVEKKFQEQIIPLDTMGAWVRLVLKEKEGVVRGYELGMSIDSIKTKEKGKILEENAQKKLITYTYDFDDDFVDVTYEYNEQRKVKTVKINATVNGVESFLEDFTKYYDLRYGQSEVANDSTRTWKSEKGYRIKLIKKQKESGANIVIE